MAVAIGGASGACPPFKICDPLVVFGPPAAKSWQRACTEDLKNGTCGLSSPVLGAGGWMQGYGSRVVLP